MSNQFLVLDVWETVLGQFWWFVEGNGCWWVQTTNQQTNKQTIGNMQKSKLSQKSKMLSETVKPHWGRQMTYSIVWPAPMGVAQKPSGYPLMHPRESVFIWVVLKNVLHLSMSYQLTYTKIDAPPTLPQFWLTQNHCVFVVLHKVPAIWQLQKESLRRAIFCKEKSQDMMCPGFA